MTLLRSSVRVVSMRPPRSARALTANEPRMSDYIPYSSHVTDRILRTTEGDYVQAWRVAGLPFEAASDADLLSRHEAFNQLVRNIADQGVAVWIHRIRRRTTPQLQGCFDNPFCAELDRRYQRHVSEPALMVTEIYLTMIYRDSAAASDRFACPAHIDALQLLQQQAIVAVEDLGRQIETSLARYGMTPLGATGKEAKRRSDLLQLYSFLLNGTWESQPVPRGPICDTLATSRLLFGREHVEIRAPAQTRHALLLDIKDYPEWSGPGILNPLLYGDFEYIETQSFSPLGRSSARSVIEHQRNRLITANDPAQSQIAALDQALDQLVNGHFVLGEYHYSLALLAERAEDLGRHLADARTALLDQGFQSVRIDLVADAAWFAQLPANWSLRPRRAYLSSRNFCGMASMHNVVTGKAAHNPWGEAVTLLRGASGQPFFFNFHATPPEERSGGLYAAANTMIIGRTGSGKTVTELFLLAQAMKFAPRVVLFDKDRGSEIALRAMGGHYLVLKRGEPTGLNPFLSEVNGQTLLFWEKFVSQLVSSDGHVLSPDERADIGHAVRTVATFPTHLRRLLTVRQNLVGVGSNTLPARLTRWCEGGPLSWVFDDPGAAQPLFASSPARVHGFDTTEFLDDPEIRTPIMMTLLQWTEGIMDGSRFIYVMTEFWKALDDPIFMEFVRNKQKTIRKQNGLGLFDTQSPADALQSPIARTLIEQTATFIFLPNPQADHDDYVEGFKLSEAEFQLVRSLGESNRSFLVKQGHRAALARLDLTGLDDLLVVLSGTTDAVRRLDTIRAQVGDDPQQWLPILMGGMPGGKVTQRFP